MFIIFLPSGLTVKISNALSPHPIIKFPITSPETKSLLILTILAVVFCIALIFYNNYFLKKISTIDD